jgi:hypothetical protein
MKPVVREYTNDEQLVQDVKELQRLGVNSEDVYVLSHDDDRTDRVADHANANTIGSAETGLASTVENIFNKKGDELRNKIHEIGFTEAEAAQFEKKLDEGKVLLFVTDTEKASLWS